MKATDLITQIALDLAHNPRSIEYIVERLTNLYSIAKIDGKLEYVQKRIDDFKWQPIGDAITEPEQIDPFTKLNPEE